MRATAQVSPVLFPSTSTHMAWIFIQQPTHPPTSEHTSIYNRQRKSSAFVFPTSKAAHRKCMPVSTAGPDIRNSLPSLLSAPSHSSHPLPPLCSFFFSFSLRFYHLKNRTMKWSCNENFLPFPTSLHLYRTPNQNTAKVKFSTIGTQSISFPLHSAEDKYALRKSGSCNRDFSAS